MMRKKKTSPSMAKLYEVCGGQRRWEGWSWEEDGTTTGNKISWEKLGQVHKSFSTILKSNIF